MHVHKIHVFLYVVPVFSLSGFFLGFVFVFGGIDLVAGKVRFDVGAARYHPSRMSLCAVTLPVVARTRPLPVSIRLLPISPGPPASSLFYLLASFPQPSRVGVRASFLWP